MDRSQYLIQALQGLGQAPAAPVSQGPDLAAMQAAVQQRKDYEAANPGKSYARHRLDQAIAGVKGAPGAILNAPQAALGGLFSLGKAVP